jgi:hypothetical protein
MPRYDWYNRCNIENKPAIYFVYHKQTGQCLYNGKADRAFDRLAKGHPQYVEGTYVVITYYHRNTSSNTLLDIEASTLRNARTPRKNIQNNPNETIYCLYPKCRRTVIYPEKYCWQHRDWW